MNFLRSRLAIGHLLGQRRQGMCNKPAESKPEASAAAAVQEPRPSFRVPGYKPTDWDKKVFLWSGRFKSVDQIPQTVSFEMVDAARNRLRVKIAYVMMAATLGACLVMVLMGKKAVARNETLTSYNLEKKAKWRDENQK